MHWFRQLANMAPILVWMSDGEGRLTFVNNGWLRYTGQLDTDAIGGGAFNHVHPEDFEKVMAAWRQSSTTDEVFMAQYRLRRHDGQYRWFSSTAAPLVSPDGGSEGFLGCHVDVTESYQQNLKEQQARKLEAIGQLAGGVAHDFNNVLTVIMHLTELMTVATPEGTQAHADLQEIRLAARRGANMTKQLLAFSRQQVLCPETFYPGDVVTHLTPMMRSLIGEHIDLMVEAANECGHIEADRGQLEQVLMNLILNARDAIHPRSGHILVTTSRVLNPAGIPAGHYCVIRIRDDGCGIPSDIVGRIFEPFFTTKPSGQGTGLGLSTVYGIVTQSGGYLRTESLPGKGSTFSVYFPEVTLPIRTNGSQKIVAPGDMPRGRGEILLLVEDNDPVRRAVSRQLHDSNYHVIEAQNGRQAMEKLLHHYGPLHGVVTDLCMPEMTGTEFARQVRLVRPFLPVLFMSGFAYEVVMDPDFQRNEVTEFLQKPHDFTDLLTTLNRLLKAVPDEHCQPWLPVHGTLPSV